MNVLDLLRELPPDARIERVELLNATHREQLPRFDQTLTPVGECGIEFVVRKAPAREVQSLGRRPSDEQPAADLRAHYNQYRDDMATLKRNNRDAPPFTNSDEL